MLDTIARNPDVPFKDRVAAYHLACELTVVIPKMPTIFSSIFVALRLTDVKWPR